MMCHVVLMTQALPHIVEGNTNDRVTECAGNVKSASADGICMCMEGGSVSLPCLTMAMGYCTLILSLTHAE